LPARLRDLTRALQSYGISVEKPSSGSHWKASKDGIVYPLPCHNGPKTELADYYLKGVARAFGLDFNEMKKRM